MTNPTHPDERGEVVTDEMAVILQSFLRMGGYLAHPKVPYAGTVNGDSEEAWALRLHKAALKAALDASPQQQAKEQGSAEVGERAEFEKWSETMGWKSWSKRDNSTYFNGQLQGMWRAWQARSSLFSEVSRG